MEIIPTTYFGPVSWYARIARAGGQVAIEACENYMKQTLRNHCRIATANGIQKLTIPVSVPERNALTGNIREVRISDHGNWRHTHWEALATAYGMSPFFEYYADDIRPFFEQRWEFLFDYNLDITRRMLLLLGIDTEIVLTDMYGSRHDCTASAQGEGSASAATLPGIRPYYQTFQRRHGFLPDMSILDLLFNEGPEAKLYLTV